MSDNGGQTNAGAKNFPLRGGRMTVFEGGHRVRAFISGVDVKPYVNEGMFHSVDWLPTILNAAIGIPIRNAITFLLVLKLFQTTFFK